MRMGFAALSSSPTLKANPIAGIIPTTAYETQTSAIPIINNDVAGYTTFSFETDSEMYAFMAKSIFSGIAFLCSLNLLLYCLIIKHDKPDLVAPIEAPI